MKIILISILLLFATNPKTKPPEPKWIGSFDIYMSNEYEFEVRYRGIYPKCTNLYIIERVFSDCDTILNRVELDSMFNFEPIIKIKTEKL